MGYKPLQGDLRDVGKMQRQDFKKNIDKFAYTILFQ